MGGMHWIGVIAIQSHYSIDNICPKVNMKIWGKCNQSASNNTRIQIIHWKLIRSVGEVVKLILSIS